jgi:predicted nucleic acid-binding protein
MTEYFDTPMLVFAAANKGSLGQKAWQAIADSADAVTTPHALAECFNALTYRLHIPPGAARKMIEEQAAKFRFEMLDAADYRLAIAAVVEQGQTGDKIYDALHLRAAMKCGAKKIHTSNKRDFSPFHSGIEIVKLG